MNNNLKGLAKFTQEKKDNVLTIAEKRVLTQILTDVIMCLKTEEIDGEYMLTDGGRFIKCLSFDTYQLLCNGAMKLIKQDCNE